MAQFPGIEILLKTLLLILYMLIEFLFIIIMIILATKREKNIGLSLKDPFDSHYGQIKKCLWYLKPSNAFIYTEWEDFSFS